MSATQTYRKSRMGVYPGDFGWGWQVVASDGTRVSCAGYATEADAKKGARHQARFQDRLERDRVDGVVSKATDRVLERGVRVCEKCGKPHDLVATTRRGRRWGQTWASPDCGTYRPESREALARRLQSEAVVA
jgi:hypothetical protein